MVEEKVEEKRHLVEVLGIDEDELDTRRKVLNDLLFVVNRTCQVIERFSQFKINELIAKGIKVNYSSDVRLEENCVYMVIKIELSDDFIDEIAKEVSKVRKLRTRVRESAVFNDNTLYRFRDIDKMLDIKSLIKSGKGSVKEKEEVDEGESSERLKAPESSS